MCDTDQTEINIFQAPDHMRLIYEAMPIGIVIVDSETRIISANKTLVDMMGGNNLIETGKRFGDGLLCIGSLLNGCGNGDACILCEIREYIMKAFRTGLIYDNVIIKHEFIINDNEVSPWFKMSFVPLTLNEITYVMITADDVTDLKS